MTEPERIQIRAAARKLGVSVSCTRRLFCSGRIAAAKIGGIWTVAPADVEAYIQRNTAVFAQCQNLPTTYTNATGFGGLESRSMDETPAGLYGRVIASKPASGSRRS